MLQGIVRAIHYGTRLLARSPLVTATAILSLSGYRRETTQSSPSANVLLVAPATVWGKETTREPGGTENGSASTECPAYCMPTYETVYNFSKMSQPIGWSPPLGAHS
jgi:hypothetical protein